MVKASRWTCLRQVGGPSRTFPASQAAYSERNGTRRNEVGRSVHLKGWLAKCYQRQSTTWQTPAYAGLQQRYRGSACGKHVHLKLLLFTAVVTTSVTYFYASSGVGVHPRSAAQRHMTAQKHSKFLRQLIIRVCSSTNTALHLAELGRLLLQQIKLVAGLHAVSYDEMRFGCFACLPVDDLSRDMLYSP